MSIKGVIFDIGQTLINQLFKERSYNRSEEFFSHVYDYLLEKQVPNHFECFPSKSEFISELTILYKTTRAEKNQSTHFYIEVPLFSQALEVLVSFNNKHSQKIASVEDHRHLMPLLEDAFRQPSFVDDSAYECWPDTLKTLKELKRLGFKIALASNTAHPVKHEVVMKKFGISSIVDADVISGYCGVRKPNPKMLDLCCSLLELPKEEVVVVGDLLDRDILLANLCGVRSIWINAIPYDIEQNLKRIREGSAQYLPTAGICCLSQLIPTIEYLNSVTPEPDQVKVGYYFPDIKKKLETGRKKAFVPNSKIFYMPIEIRSPPEKLGSFDVIIQKVTDLYFSTNKKDQEALEGLQEYMDKHPEVLVLDPLEDLALTNNRKVFCEQFPCIEFEDGVRVRPPRLLKSTKEFPCIVKDERACTAPGVHEVTIAFNSAGLDAVLQNFKGNPVVQEWVPHSKGLFKVYVLGEDFQVKPRRGCDFSEPPDFLKFNYHKDWPQGIKEVPNCTQISNEVVSRINHQISELTGLGLISYDLLVETDTQFVIVDLNYFPNYLGYENFAEKMDAYVLSRLQKHNLNL